jgi:hypothetical protein
MAKALALRLGYEDLNEIAIDRQMKACATAAGAITNTECAPFADA